MPRQRQERPTHILVWCAAIICAILTVCVIIGGIIVFIVYMVMHPRVPYISVVDAHLDTFQSSQAGSLEIQARVVMRAQNGNEKAHASFYDWHFVLSLNRFPLAHLVAGDFDVEKNHFMEFPYEVQSKPTALGPDDEDVVDLSLKRDLVSLNLNGSARTRWRVGLLGSVKFTCLLDCELRFHPRNGTYIPSHCTSKTK